MPIMCKMFHFKEGNQTEIAGMPEVVTFGTPGIPAIMHGGLVDVSIHPKYSTNSWVYISYLDSDGLAKVSQLKIQNNGANDTKGGDEFNVIEKGTNYDWPLFTYGINYDGAWASTISEDSAAKFTVLPEYYWTVLTDDSGQTITPACLLKVNKSNISDWNDYFVFGSLAFRRLMKYNREIDETFGLNIEGRVRTIKQLPSGDLIALIERNDLNQSNGMILKISKKKAENKVQRLVSLSAIIVRTDRWAQKSTSL